MFLLKIIRILLMKVLKLTKLVPFIKWQCYKHERSPNNIFRLNKHLTVVRKSHQSSSQWKH